MRCSCLELKTLCVAIRNATQVPVPRRQLVFMPGGLLACKLQKYMQAIM
jgi:hypothetical protein